MKHAVIDCETTISNDGNPFDSTNKLAYVGVRIDGTNHLFPIEFSEHPWGDAQREIRALLDSVDLYVFFNAKFDIHWLKRYGLALAPGKPIWDCQYVEYVLSGQEIQLPSLNETSERRGLGSKIDEVAKFYWDKGFDTMQVPEALLRDYLGQDLILTDK